MGVRRRKPQQPQKVGKYVLGKTIGVGGFGVVLRATNEETGEEVAVKVLDKAHLHLMQMTSQIKREITLLTTLKHPNIVNGLEILNSTAKLYMVMELVEGGDMHTLVSEQRKIPEHDARRYFAGLMKCLAYCHERGVSHRDLKLENLLVTKEGGLKVCDFGLASVRTHNSDASSLCSTVAGTEDFAAPEILLRQPYEGDKSDMWSAGIILYTMITGFCPFRGDDTTQLFNAIKTCRFSFPENFPALAKRVVLTLLVANPQNRPSAQHVLEMGWLQGASDSSLSSKEQEVLPLPEGELTPLQDELAFRTESGDADPEKNLSSFSLQQGSNRGASKRIRSSYQKLRKHIQDNPALALASKVVEGFPEIYAAIRQDKTLVKDRRWRLRSFPDTFVGSEMVSWLSDYCKATREEALDIGERMLQSEVFHHVCRDHAFKDEYLFYRFAEDSPDSTVLNMRQYWPLAIPPGHPLQVAISLLNSLLALIQLHQVLPEVNTQGHAEVLVEGLQQDSAFFAFRMAVAELQVVDLALLANRRQRMAFCINLYQIMILHIRCLGEEGGYGRSQTKLRNRFQYHIAGGRISLNELEDLLQYEQVTSTRSAYEGSTSRLSGFMSSSQQDSGSSSRLSGFLSNSQQDPGSSSRLSGFLISSPPDSCPSRSMLLSLSPRAVNLASSDGPLRNSTKSMGPRTGLFGVSRRMDVINVASSLRVEFQKQEYLFMFVGDGSPSDPAMRSFQERDVAPDALMKGLALFLMEKMKINAKDTSVSLPSSMAMYRRQNRIFGDKDLVHHLILFFSNFRSKAMLQDNNFGLSDETLALLDRKLSDLHALQSANLPVHVWMVEEDSDACFAPNIHEGAL